MPDSAPDTPSRPNYDLIVQLLNDALTALDVDSEKARRDILYARTLALEPIGSVPVGAGGLANWQMRRIADFVHFNLSTRLRIDQVAQVLKMSPGYLSRAFKASSGITYSEFVLRARIELAKRLLLTTDTPIAEIALACGLTDQSHLTRIFKRSVGLPPATWRKRYADDAAEMPHGLDEGSEAGDYGLAAASADGRRSVADHQVRRGDVVIFPGGDRACPVHGAAAIWDCLEIVAVASDREKTRNRRTTFTASVAGPSGCGAPSQETGGEVDADRPPKAIYR